MNGQAINHRTTRRSALRAAAGTVLAVAGGRRALAAASGRELDQAVEWARANLPRSTPEIVRAAAAEGRMAMTLENLGGNDAALKQLIGLFNKRYPFIDVGYTMQTTVQLLNKFNAEIAAGRGVNDYVNLPSNLQQTGMFEKRGALLSYVVSDDAAFPAAAKSSGLWYAFRRENPTTVYRSDALSDEEKRMVQTYEGLGDPRFRGRLGINSVSNSVSVAGAYVLLYGSDPALWQRLVANQPKVKPSSVTLVDGVLTGEYDVGLFCGSASPANAARQGAPVEFGISTPSPTLYTPGGISAFAQSPNSARLWQDWVMSREGQENWVQLSGSPSARRDLGVKTWAERHDWYFDRSSDAGFDWAGFTAKEQEVIARFTKDIQGS